MESGFNQVNIQELLNEYNIPFKSGGSHQHVRPGWIGVNCPWCRTSSWHLGIRESDQLCVCWRCGFHRFGDALMELLGRSWGEVRDLIGSVQGQRPPVRSFDGPKRPSKVVYPSGVGLLQEPHRTALERRGFDPVEIEQVWGVGGIGVTARLRWKLFIPIQVRGVTVTWTTRAVGETGTRYMSARPDEEVTPIKSILYGVDLVPGGSIVVHEGPTDCWATGPGAVGVSGLNVSPTQVAEIGSYQRRTICFDSTRDAQKRAKKLAEKLVTVPGETNVVRLESGSDPAEADPDEIAELRKLYL